MTSQFESHDPVLLPIHRLNEILQFALTSAGATVFTWDISLNEVRRYSFTDADRGTKLDAPDTFEGVLEKVYPDDRDHFEKTVRQSIAEPMSEYRNAYRVTGADGSIRFIQDIGRVELDAEGKARQLIGIATDVTDQKTREEKLHESETFNSSLMDGSADCIKVLDLDGRLLHMNAPGLCQMEIDDFGPLCGREWASLWPTNVKTHIQQSLDAARRGKTYSFKANCPTAKGTPKMWDVVVSPIRNSDDGQVVRLLSVSRDITEQQRVEEQVQINEHTLRLTMEATATGVWDWNIATDVVHWSTECYQIHGISEEEFNGTAAGFDRLVHPDDRERVWTTVRQAIEKRNRYECEFRIVRPDGEIRWVANTGRAIYDNDRSIQMIGTIIDITERKKADEAAERAAEQLRLAVEISGLGVGQIDYLTDTIILDPTAASLFGLAADAPHPRAALHARFHPEDKEKIYLLMSHSLDPTVEEKFNMEHRIVLPDGSIRWLRVRKQVSFSNVAGVRRPVSGILAAVDITARKEAEIERAQTLATMNSLIASAPVGIVLFDAEMRYRHLNKPLADMNGFPVEAHIGRTVKEIIPNLHESVEVVFRKVLKQGVTVPDFVIEGETPKAPGIKRAWRESWFPVLGPNGLPQGVGAIVQEITEQRLAEQLIVRNDERLRAALTAARMVSWEWNVSDGKLRMSENASDVFGLPGGVGLPSIDQGIALLHPDDEPAYRATFQAAIAKQGSYLTHYRLIRPDNEQVVWIEERGTAVSDETGGVRVHGIAMDVSKQHETTEQLRSNEQRMRLATQATGVGA